MCDIIIKEVHLHIVKCETSGMAFKLDLWLHWMLQVPLELPVKSSVHVDKMQKRAFNVLGIWGTDDLGSCSPRTAEVGEEASFAVER